MSLKNVRTFKNCHVVNTLAYRFCKKRKTILYLFYRQPKSVVFEYSLRKKHNVLSEAVLSALQLIQRNLITVDAFKPMYVLCTFILSKVIFHILD